MLATLAMLTLIEAARPGCPAQDADPLCASVPENLSRAEDALRKLSTPPELKARNSWDRHTPPQYLDTVDARFDLTTAEKNLLEKNGFVVSGREIGDYTTSFHEIYQSQLPIYVSVDSVLHAIWRTNEAAVGDFEVRVLTPMLEGALKKLRKGLKANRAAYAAETARDLDVYLEVAQVLLAQTAPETEPTYEDPDAPPAAPPPPPSAAAQAILALVATEAGFSTIPLFGRQELVDLSTFTPRGPYENRPGYFRAVSWLSRVDFPIARHKDGAIVPAEPSELRAALALSDLLRRSGAARDFEDFDAIWALWAGTRTDLSFTRLGALAARVGPSGAKLAALLLPADEPRASVRPSREWEDPRPFTASLIGARTVIDTEANSLLVNASVRDRTLASAADVAYYFGHDRALAYLTAPLATYPGLKAKLAEARALAFGARAEDTLYSAWFDAIRALSAAPKGVVNTYAETPAFADLRMSSTVVAYGQLRHQFVLMTSESYEEGGCEIPDGYVEPALESWNALIRYTQVGAKVLARLPPAPRKRGKAPVLDAPDPTPIREAWIARFQRMEQILVVLRNIVRFELTNQPLPVDAKRFLSMVSEIHHNIYMRSCGPNFDGWYFDLLPTGVESVDPSFIASFQTSSTTGQIAYLGAHNPKLGFFVVDTGGPPRLMVGPVASGFEYVGDVSQRIADSQLDSVKTSPLPWAAGHSAPGAEPATVKVTCNLDAPGDKVPCTATSASPERGVVISAHGYHSEVVWSVTLDVGPRAVEFAVPAKSRWLSIRQGELRGSERLKFNPLGE